MKILGLGLLLSISALTAQAYEGEVQQIDSSNLRSFAAGYPGGCTEVFQSESNYYFYSMFTIQQTIVYSDGKQDRLLYLPRIGYGAKMMSVSSATPERRAEECGVAKARAVSALGYSNTILNDIARGNVSVSKHGGCEQRYLLATLGRQVVLGDKRIADEAVVETPFRAVKCP